MTLGSAVERRHAPRLAPAALWFGFLGGIVAWAIGFTASYPLSAGCTTGAAIGAWAVSLVTLLVTAAAAFTAWRNWSAMREVTERGAGGWPGRATFMGFGGLLLSGAAVVLTVAHLVPLLLLAPCAPG